MAWDALNVRLNVVIVVRISCSLVGGFAPMSLIRNLKLISPSRVLRLMLCILRNL